MAEDIIEQEPIEEQEDLEIEEDIDDLDEDFED